jgi:hypothetical protein
MLMFSFSLRCLFLLFFFLILLQERLQPCVLLPVAPASFFDLPLSVAGQYYYMRIVIPP